MTNGMLGIYDLGGDRFSFSVLKVTDGEFEILGEKSLENFGGNTFDKILKDHICEEFKKETDIDLSNDPLAIGRIYELSENVKQELSTLQKREINAPYITSDSTGPKHIMMEMSRFQLEKLYNENINNTLKPITELLEELNLNKENIDHILLVGGMTKMIEPIIIVVLGGIIACILVAMYLPMFMSAGGAD